MKAVHYCQCCRKEEEEVKDASLVEVVYDFEQYDLDSFVSLCLR